MRFPGRGRLLYSAGATALSGVVLLVITLTGGQAAPESAVIAPSTLTGQVIAFPQQAAGPADTPTPTDTPTPPTPTDTATSTPTPTHTATSTPTPVRATLTLTAPSSVAVLQPVTLTGTLTLAGGAALPQSATFTLTRAAPDGTTATVTIKPAATGSFSFTNLPPAAGAWTYSAHYAGTATISAATATFQVTITRLATTLSLAASANVVNYQAAVSVTAHLGATYEGRQVSVYRQTVRSTARTLIKTGTVDSKGDLTAGYAPQYSTTFSVVFPGDARYAARTVIRDVYVRVSITQSLSSYYASETYKGILYRVYHHTSTLHDAITVAPNKQGECVRAEIQVFFQGAWIDDLPNGTTDCGTLSSTSHVPGTFGLGNAAGARYRIRALFVRSASDGRNLNNSSSRRYFRVAT